MYNGEAIRVPMLEDLHTMLALRLNVPDVLMADGVYGRFAFIDSLIHGFINTPEHSKQ